MIKSMSSISLSPVKRLFSHERSRLRVVNACPSSSWICLAIRFFSSSLADSRYADKLRSCSWDFFSSSTRLRSVRSLAMVLVFNSSPFALTSVDIFRLAAKVDPSFLTNSLSTSRCTLLSFNEGNSFTCNFFDSSVKKSDSGLPIISSLL